MSDKHITLSEFDVEGQLLGFVGDEPGKFKYLRLALESKELQIKIPKELRRSVCLSLVPGDRIRVFGISKLDSHTGEIKLKAYGVSPTGDYPQEKMSTEEQTSAPETPVRNAPKAKILVCQKSGCRKRGGTSLLLELEQAMRSRNLLEQVTIEYTGCQKRCSSAPNYVLHLGNKQYTRIHPEAIASLVEEHLS